MQNLVFERRVVSWAVGLDKRGIGGTTDTRRTGTARGGGRRIGIESEIATVGIGIGIEIETMILAPAGRTMVLLHGEMSGTATATGTGRRRGTDGIAEGAILERGRGRGTVVEMGIGIGTGREEGSMMIS